MHYKLQYKNIIQLNCKFVQINIEALAKAID